MHAKKNNIIARKLPLEEGKKKVIILPDNARPPGYNFGKVEVISVGPDVKDETIKKGTVLYVSPSPALVMAINPTSEFPKSKDGLIVIFPETAIYYSE